MSIVARDSALLSALADPEAPAIVPDNLTGVDPARLFGMISSHGIEPVAVRKLKALSHGLGHEWQEAILTASKRQFHANAISLELESRASRLLSAFRSAKISAAIIKGPDFAQNLYSVPGDRIFTDIDFLLARPDWLRAADVMRAEGYVGRHPRERNRARRTLEQKWLDSANNALLVELHADLVHDPSLRRSLSFGHEELEMIANAAAARFLIAVLHAAAGHKMHKLQLLVDVLQAFRALDRMAMDRVVHGCRHLHADLEVNCCLRLIAAIFDCPSAVRFSGRFQRGILQDWGQKLISANTIMSAPDDPWQISRSRRRLFRTIQTFLPR